MVKNHCNPCPCCVGGQRRKRRSPNKWPRRAGFIFVGIVFFIVRNHLLRNKSQREISDLLAIYVYWAIYRCFGHGVVLFYWIGRGIQFSAWTRIRRGKWSILVHFLRPDVQEKNPLLWRFVVAVFNILLCPLIASYLRCVFTDTGYHSIVHAAK